jgi:limonene-1,2-epoxide hydrolase
VSSDNDAAALAVVQDMIDAWDNMEFDRVVELFTPDGVLQSMMQDPIVGREAIGARMTALVAGLERITLRVKAMGVIGGRVFVERVDDFDVNGHHGEVPVVGVLTIQDGLVAEWLEYYDRATLVAGMGLSQDFAGH